MLQNWRSCSCSESVFSSVVLFMSRICRSLLTELRDTHWFYLTSASTHCSMCVCHMSLKDLLTYLLTEWACALCAVSDHVISSRGTTDRRHLSRSASDTSASELSKPASHYTASSGVNKVVAASMAIGDFNRFASQKLSLLDHSCPACSPPPIFSSLWHVVSNFQDN